MPAPSNFPTWDQVRSSEDFLTMNYSDRLEVANNYHDSLKEYYPDEADSIEETKGLWASNLDKSFADPYKSEELASAKQERLELGESLIQDWDTALQGNTKKGDVDLGIDGTFSEGGGIVRNDEAFEARERRDALLKELGVSYEQGEALVEDAKRHLGTSDSFDYTDPETKEKVSRNILLDSDGLIAYKPSMTTHPDRVSVLFDEIDKSDALETTKTYTKRKIEQDLERNLQATEARYDSLLEKIEEQQPKSVWGKALKGALKVVPQTAATTNYVDTDNIGVVDEITKAIEGGATKRDAILQVIKDQEGMLESLESGVDSDRLAVSGWGSALEYLALGTKSPKGELIAERQAFIQEMREGVSGKSAIAFDVGRTAPQVARQIGASIINPAAGVALAGVEATFSSASEFAYDPEIQARIESGELKDTDVRAAAVGVGLMTAGTSAVFNKGVESMSTLAGRKAISSTLSSKIIKNLKGSSPFTSKLSNASKGLAKGVADEVIEETSQSALQYMWTENLKGKDPDWAEFASDLPRLMIVSALFGGSMGAVSGAFNSNGTYNPAKAKLAVDELQKRARAGEDIFNEAGTGENASEFAKDPLGDKSVKAFAKAAKMTEDEARAELESTLKLGVESAPKDKVELGVEELGKGGSLDDGFGDVSELLDYDKGETKERATIKSFTDNPVDFLNKKNNEAPESELESPALDSERGGGESLPIVEGQEGNIGQPAGARVDGTEGESDLVSVPRGDNPPQEGTGATGSKDADNQANQDAERETVTVDPLEPDDIQQGDTGDTAITESELAGVPETNEATVGVAPEEQAEQAEVGEDGAGTGGEVEPEVTEQPSSAPKLKASDVEVGDIVTTEDGIKHKVRSINPQENGEIELDFTDPSNITVPPDAEVTVSKSAPSPSGNASVSPNEASFKKSDQGKAAENHKRVKRAVFRKAAEKAQSEGIIKNAIEFANLSPKDQFKYLSGWVKSAATFKSISADEAGTGLRNAIDNLQENVSQFVNMANALNVSSNVIGLNGSLSLKYDSVRRRFLGLYADSEKSIQVQGRERSFAHEHGHAIDYWIWDNSNMPERGRGASGARRAGTNNLTLPERLETPFRNMMQAIFYKDAELATEIRDLEMKIQKARTEKSRNRHKESLETLISGAGRKKGLTSDFRQNALDANGSYWSRPTELIARSYEAFVANEMEAQGMEVDSIAESMKFYNGDTKQDLARLYPQGAEREAIFNAWRQVMATIEGEMGDGKRQNSDTKKFKESDFINEPVRKGVWDRMGLDFSRDYSNESNERKNINKLSRSSQTLIGKLHTSFLSDALVPISDTLKILESRYRTQAKAEKLKTGNKVVTKEQADNIADIVQDLRELAVGRFGSGKDVMPNWQLAQNKLVDSVNNRISMAYSSQGLDGRTSHPEIDQEVRDILASSGKELSSFSKEARAIAVVVRKENDKLYEDVVNLYDQKSKTDGIGFIPDDYFRRYYNRAKADSDGQGFITQATNLYSRMAQDEYNSKKEELEDLENLVSSPVTEDEKSSLDKARDDLAKIRLRSPLTIQEEIDAGGKGLEGDYDNAISNVKGQADAWRQNLVYGGSVDEKLRNVGGDIQPSTSTFQERTLPEYADAIMNEYLVTDVKEVMNMHAQEIARKIEWVKRFGTDNKILKDKVQQLRKNNATPADIDLLLDQVYASFGVTGYNNAHNIVDVANTAVKLSLLARATMSAFSEPLVSGFQTNTGRGVMSFLTQFNGGITDILEKGDAYERRLALQTMGVLTREGVGIALSSRYDSGHVDDPRSNRVMNKGFLINGLSKVTQWQEEAVLNQSILWAQNDLHRRIQRGGKDGVQKDLADFGVTMDAEKFVDAVRGLGRDFNIKQVWDGMDDTERDQFSTFLNGVRSTSIQVTRLSDRPKYAQSSVGRLAYDITGFSSAFAQNVYISTVRKLQSERTTPDKARIIANAASSTALLFVVGSLVASMRHALLGGERADEEKEEMEKKIGRPISTGEFVLRNSLPFTFQEPTEDNPMGIKDFNEESMTRAMLYAMPPGLLQRPIDVVSGLRYNASPTEQFTGPFVSTASKLTVNTSKLLFSNNANTLTNEFKATRSGKDLADAVTAYAIASRLPAYGITSKLAGAAFAYGSSRSADDRVANLIVGNFSDIDLGDEEKAWINEKHSNGKFVRPTTRENWIKANKEGDVKELYKIKSSIKMRLD